MNQEEKRELVAKEISKSSPLEIKVLIKVGAEDREFGIKFEQTGNSAKASLGRLIRQALSDGFHSAGIDFY